MGKKEFEDSGNGDFNINIVKGGTYLVEAKGPNGAYNEETFIVECDLNNCDECSPRHVISMPKILTEGQAEVMLSWSGEPNKLKLHLWSLDWKLESKRVLNNKENYIVTEFDGVEVVYVKTDAKFTPTTGAKVDVKGYDGQSFKAINRFLVPNPTEDIAFKWKISSYCQDKEW